MSRFGGYKPSSEGMTLVQMLEEASEQVDALKGQGAAEEAIEALAEQRAKSDSTAGQEGRAKLGLTLMDKVKLLGRILDKQQTSNDAPKPPQSAKPPAKPQTPAQGGQSLSAQYNALMEAGDWHAATAFYTKHEAALSAEIEAAEKSEGSDDDDGVIVRGHDNPWHPNNRNKAKASASNSDNSESANVGEQYLRLMSTGRYAEASAFLTKHQAEIDALTPR